MCVTADGMSAARCPGLRDGWGSARGSVRGSVYGGKSYADADSESGCLAGRGRMMDGLDDSGNAATDTTCVDDKENDDDDDDDDDDVFLSVIL